MNRLKQCYSVWLLTAMLLIRFCGHAQTKSDSVQQWFTAYQQQTLQEKVFVHTDRNFYVAGDILWFKLYNVDAYLHRPLALNKAAYVEIINADKKPVLQAQVALNNGSGSGSFQLPSSINSGTYLLRAYTGWMKNFSADYFFQSPITIVNTQKRPDWQALQPPLTADVQFFPEGGNLVQGLSSVVGFKVTDQYGDGLDGEGVVLDKANDTVQRFRTLRFGMGRFLFTPQQGNAYKALIFLSNGMRILKSLPTAYATGYVMHLLKPDENILQVKVQSNVPDAPVSLFVHTRGIMKVLQQKILQNGNVLFTLDKAALGEGISHLTVFTREGQPACERLYFKQPALDSTITLATDKAVYAPRQKVRLTLNSETFSNAHTSPDLSLSVYKTDSLQEVNHGNMGLYLWLTSDLRGRIEDPEFYFNNADRDATEALENLLLTQGWRRFRWEDIAGGKKFVPAYPAEYEGAMIQARISESRSGTPVHGVAAYLSAPGEPFWLSSATSNDSGLLSFAVNRFHNTGNLVIQTANAADSIYHIDMLNPFSEQTSVVVPPRFQVSEKWKAALEEQNLSMQSATAFLKEQLQKYRVPETNDTMAFYGKPDAAYALDAYTRFTTMEEVMREYVPEVRVRRQSNGFQYSVKNTPYKLYFDENPLVLVDGVPVNDINTILALDPLKIRKLDVVARRYFVGNRTASGIVSYTSYAGDLAGLALSKQAVVLDQAGLQAQREFYSPAYAVEQQRVSRLPDFRQVLYWSANVQTDTSGKATITFYTADLPGHYQVEAEGITSDGHPLHGTARFTVTQ